MVLDRPRVEILETKMREDGVTQRKVRIEIAPGQMGDGYVLLPRAAGRHPAVFVPYYDPETSAGLSEKPLRDFAWQLARRGVKPRGAPRPWPGRSAAGGV